MSGPLPAVTEAERPASRAFNVDATKAQVLAMAAKHDATISAIEPLQPQGTRVVFQNGHDAAVVARAFGAKVLKGAVKRTPWIQQRLS